MPNRSQSSPAQSWGHSGPVLPGWSGEDVLFDARENDCTKRWGWKREQLCASCSVAFIMFLVPLRPVKNSLRPQCAPHQPPFPPFFFFCCCFFFVAGAPAGFWCLGGMMLLVEADTAAALPGLGDVGGLLTVLLASSSDDDAAVAPCVPFPIWSFFLPFFRPR